MPRPSPSGQQSVEQSSTHHGRQQGSTATILPAQTNLEAKKVNMLDHAPHQLTTIANKGQPQQSFPLKQATTNSNHNKAKKKKWTCWTMHHPSPSDKQSVERSSTDYDRQQGSTATILPAQGGTSSFVIHVVYSFVMRNGSYRPNYRNDPESTVWKWKAVWSPCEGAVEWRECLLFLVMQRV